MAPSFDKTALLLLDLQNDFLHPDGAYARGGVTSDLVSAVPARVQPVADAFRAAGAPIVSTHFTLVPGRGDEPLIQPHLKKLRPFLRKGDFAPGGWGHGLFGDLGPSDFSVEKIAYSAFYMSRLEWVLDQVGADHLVCAGIVTNGGVASTVRDAHVRGYHVTVLSDGCAAFDARVHDVAIESLKGIADIATCEGFLA